MGGKRASGKLPEGFRFLGRTISRGTLQNYKLFFLFYFFFFFFPNVHAHSRSSTGGGPALGRSGSRDGIPAARGLALAGAHGWKGWGPRGCWGAASPRAAPEWAKQDEKGSRFPPCPKTLSFGLLSPGWPCGGDAPGSGTACWWGRGGTRWGETPRREVEGDRQCGGTRQGRVRRAALSAFWQDTLLHLAADSPARAT